MKFLTPEEQKRFYKKLPFLVNFINKDGRVVWRNKKTEYSEDKVPVSKKQLISDVFSGGEEIHRQVRMENKVLKIILFPLRDTLVIEMVSDISLQFTDPLTCAFNRRVMTQFLSEEEKRIKRYGTKCCLVMIDLDNFKQINDNHGHSTGDTVLKELCDVSRKHLRSSDMLCRWGGEEFLIMLPGSSISDAKEIIKRIGSRIKKHGFGKGLKVTMSVGITEIKEDDKDVSIAIKRADDAMYFSKEAKDMITVV